MKKFLLSIGLVGSMIAAAQDDPFAGTIMPKIRAADLKTCLNAHSTIKDAPISYGCKADDEETKKAERSGQFIDGGSGTGGKRLKEGVVCTTCFQKYFDDEAVWKDSRDFKKVEEGKRMLSDVFKDFPTDYGNLEIIGGNVNRSQSRDKRLKCEELRIVMKGDPQEALKTIATWLPKSLKFEAAEGELETPYLNWEVGNRLFHARDYWFEPPTIYLFVGWSEKE
jgi:hypothetical protein